MKKKDLKDIRAKSEKQLKKLVDSKKLEIIKIKAEMKVGKEKDLKKVKKMKQDLAQILTVLREKEISKNNPITQ